MLVTILSSEIYVSRYCDTEVAVALFLKVKVTL